MEFVREIREYTDSGALKIITEMKDDNGEIKRHIRFVVGDVKPEVKQVNGNV